MSAEIVSSLVINIKIFCGMTVVSAVVSVTMKLNRCGTEGVGLCRYISMSIRPVYVETPVEQSLLITYLVYASRSIKLKNFRIVNL